MARPILLIWTSCALLLATPAFAQLTGNPAGASPDTPNIDTGFPPPAHPNQPDLLFTRQAALGNSAEVEFGRMAERQAQSPEVRDFGKRMVDDHSRSNEQLAKLAKANNVPLRKGLDPERKARQADLSKLKGAAFDAAYMQGQIQERQKTALLLQYHLAAGQDARLHSYSVETLPIVLRHLDLAKTIQTQLEG